MGEGLVVSYTGLKRTAVLGLILQCFSAGPAMAEGSSELGEEPPSGTTAAEAQSQPASSDAPLPEGSPFELELDLRESPAVTSEPLPTVEQVKVHKIQLKGNRALPTSEFEDLLAPWEGRVVTFDQIRRLSEEIVGRYREHDYLTVSTYLPEQDLTSGTLTIRVVEAQIGTVSVEGNRFYSDDYLRWMFEPALGEGGDTDLPRNSAVQRQLLLMNDQRDLNVRSVLREGSKEGEVDVVLQVSDSRPLHFGIDYNNLGSRTTGEHRLGATFQWGNLSGRGDTLSLRYVNSGLLNADTDGVNLFMVGYQTPLNNVGTTFDLSYANSAFQVGQEFQVLDIRGRADVIRALVRHQLIRSVDANLVLEGGFIYQDIENRILGQALSEDRLREAIFGLSGDWGEGQARNYGSFRLTQDLGSALGGMSPGDPLSSRGAGGGFTKMNFDLSRVQGLSSSAYLVLRGTQQTAFAPLPYAEQYGLGGIGSVRGYSQSAYLGDSGYSLSAELRFAPLAEHRELFEIGGFIDHGGAYVKNPLPGELPNAHLTGAGVTMQFRLPEQTFIRADIGWPIGRRELGRNASRGPVPYLIFSKQF